MNNLILETHLLVLNKKHTKKIIKSKEQTKPCRKIIKSLKEATETH